MTRKQYSARFKPKVAMEAMRGGQPEIFNTDQGAQFTGEAFTGRWEQHGIRSRMDGRALDNVYTERLWRSVQSEEVYWKEYREPAEAERGLRRYFRHYNHERLHQALGYRTPAAFYNTPKGSEGMSVCGRSTAVQRHHVPGQRNLRRLQSFD